MRILLAQAVKRNMTTNGKQHDYVESLRMAKSLLITTALQKRRDEKARRLIEKYGNTLVFEPHSHFLIEEKAWQHMIGLRTRPSMVFCHPDILRAHPLTSLYYRGMAGLSIKAAKNYFGSVEKIESGDDAVRITAEKALKMARTYNLYISSVIINSTNWTLVNGHRNILATMGITLDGTMRNKIGDIGEDRVRRMMVEWLIEHRLVVEPNAAACMGDPQPRLIKLKNGVTMRFSSEPDIAFEHRGDLKATVEIKGGIDPAGALERYGAAKKSFEEAVRQSGHCRNFYLGGVFTEELKRRINSDRLVEKTYDIILLLKDESLRDDFFQELFHHTLRVL